MPKKVLLAVLALIGIFAVLAGIKFMQIRSMMAFGASYTPPPESVTSAVVREESWEPTLSAIGSVAAVQGVTVSAELGGMVKEIAFESGAVVNKGDLLVQLDVASEEAQLRSAQADADLTQIDLKRARDLQQRNVTSKSDADTAEAKYKQAAAQVDNIRALIAKKTIRAPFAGRLGIREVNLGQVLNAGDPVVSLQSLDPVYVDFSLPQQQLAQLVTGMTVRVKTDAFPGVEFPGTLTAINSSLDAATRSVPAQATLANKEGLLRPGMFVKTEVVLPEKNAVLVIPATAVSYAPSGDSVFVIESQRNEKTGETEQVVRSQLVRLGDTRGDFVAVTSGLKAGETVVSTGVFKLRNKMAVSINNTLAPTPELAPTPSNT